MFTDYFTVVVCYDDVKRGVTDNVSSIGKSETTKETTILQWRGGGERLSNLFTFITKLTHLCFFFCNMIELAMKQC